jgi:glycosyltransferase involved in cell wall biosynthesis
MNNRKATVLFLAYYFPPLNAVACVRTWALAKYLARCGWLMRVVTPRADFWAHQDPEPLQEPGAGTIDCLRTGYYWPFLSADTKASQQTVWGKLGRHIGWRLYARYGFEPMVGWNIAAHRELRSLKPASVDVVLVSGGPWTSFSLAERVAAQLQCPFVLDYRDLWTSNPFMPHWNTRRKRAKELTLLARCAAITTVSPQWARILRGSCPYDKVHIVSNGYDPQRLSKVVPWAFSQPAIVFTGTLYPPLITLDPVLLAMAQISGTPGGANLPFRLHYFGPNGGLVEERASALGVSRFVVNHDSVSRQTALSAVAGAHLVVAVTSIRDEADDVQRGVVPGKVFEALGLGKRVLAIAPLRSDVESVVGTQGLRCSGSQTKEISQYLLQSTASEAAPKLDPPAQYSWESLASAYDSLLTAVRQRGSCSAARPASPTCPL